jgi:hypothetical protein
MPEGSVKDLTAAQRKACIPVQRVDQALAELGLRPPRGRRGKPAPSDDPSFEFDPDAFRSDPTGGHA